MPIKFSDADIKDIIKLRTIDNMPMKTIGQSFGCGEKPILRILKANGITNFNSKKIEFTADELKSIYAAYESGIGANGIPKHVGLKCTAQPVIRVLKSKYGTLRDRSEQQQARMNRSTPEQIAALTANANKAAKGRKATFEERVKRAVTQEGKINSLSGYEADIFSVLSERFYKVTPGKQIEIYNADFAIGNVTVEVFGGGWAISDRKRINRYIERTKQIAKSGFHTIFIMLDNKSLIFDARKLISAVDIASLYPASPSKYWVIWGDTDGSTGLSSDIDDSAFVRPFVNVRDVTTGRYTRVPREA